MKQYILLSICIASCINAMEEQKQITTREAHEWDAQAYAQGNKIQETAALQFLQESGIDFTGKRVLDVGCGTGNISKKIAQKALLVHGIDASNNMIKYDIKTYPNTKNLTFEHAFAEDFRTQEHFDIAVTFFCLHWVESRPDAFEKMNRALKINGDCFGTVSTSSDPEPLNLTVALEMIPGLQQAYSFFKDKDILKGVGTHPTDEEFKNLLQEKGFELLSYEQKSMDFIVKNREELESYESPIVMSRPIVQIMPFMLKQWLFKQYIDLYLTKLQKNENGYYILPAVNAKVFHTRKVKDI